MPILRKYFSLILGAALMLSYGNSRGYGLATELIRAAASESDSSTPDDPSAASSTQLCGAEELDIELHSTSWHPPDENFVWVEPATYLWSSLPPAAISKPPNIA